MNSSSSFFAIVSLDEFNPASPVSLLKPLLDDLFAGMNVDHLEQPRPRIDELMGNMSWSDHDVPFLYFFGDVTQGKGCPTFLHDKDLFIRMNMQAGPLTRLRLNPEKRDGNTAILLSLKQMPWAKFLSGNDVFHVFSPLCLSLILAHLF